MTRFCREQSPRGFSALARLYLLCTPNQNRHATEAIFPKIQAWAYNRYSRSQPRKRRMKSEFTVSIVIIPSRLLCQMQANSSGAELLSTTSKLIKRKKILPLLVYVLYKLALTAGIVKREIRHFHVVVVQWRQRNVQKSVMHVQSCCFALSSYCFFYFLVAASS